ncbi:putative membrane protein [Candidatus Nanobsidianus stetteri]|uniref:Putative membrane protein n=1 Tax=Nanobsidianus stetteri TaxID=1294122 RepID=R1G8S8_NANST|nr:putative membrane protein [Candidatus Nanobsidianus stetteri]
MTSFADFIINVVNILGINLIFVFLFYFGILYFLLKFLMDSMVKAGEKGEKKDEGGSKKDINSTLAFIISISASLLLTTFTGFVSYTQYFVAFVVSMILVFFFFILLGALLTNGKIFEVIEKRLFSTEGKPSSARYIPIIIVVFIILFALLSMYYAYQKYFLSITFGTSPQAQNYIITFNPYILFAMIFFILIGIFLIFSGTGVGSEGGKGSEKQGGDKGKSQ